MFARYATRAARPLRNGARSYATETSPSGGSNTLLWLGAAVAAGGAGYYYTTRGGGDVAAKARAALKPSGEKAFKGGDQGFIELKVESVEQLSPNTKRLRFALPNADDVSGLKIASALLSKVQRPGDEKPTMRPYTPVSDEDALGHIDFVVKRYPDGPMSEHIHSLKANDTLALKGPLPKYPLGENQHNHIALIAGGTGITPMYQILRGVFKNPADKTKVTLVYGNVSEEDILLRKEIQELENLYPQRFRAFYLLDKPSENWKGGVGYITKDLLKTVLPEPKEDNIKLMVCGPPGMYKAISGPKVSPKDQGELTGILKELGYTKDQVYKF